MCCTILLWSCSGDNVPECFQGSGDLVREELLLEDFDKITVYELVKLVVRHGPEQKVEVETGEYLRGKVSAEVKEGRLELRNANNCNLFRDYGLTTFYVTVPRLTEIRSSTGFPIISDGVLTFDALTLYAESFINPETETTDGSFELDIDVQTLNIVANGIAYFKLRGAAENLGLTIAAGDSRIDAREVRAAHVNISHRGTNDMLVTPLQSLRGVIRGTGDVLSYNRPDSVAVEIRYRGRLIYPD